MSKWMMYQKIYCSATLTQETHDEITRAAWDLNSKASSFLEGKYCVSCEKVFVPGSDVSCPK